MAERARNCTNHCGKCQRHFHSEAAHSAHRVGDYASDDPEVGRHCLHPIEILDKQGEPRLVAYTEDGECHLRPPEVQHGVTIWTMAGYEQVGERWKGSTEPQEAAGDHASTDPVGEGQRG